MAKVSLDGLRIEVDHDADPAHLAERLEAFARDLAENKFADWGVKVLRDPAGHLSLAGRRDETHFDATIESNHGHAVVALTGQIELGRVKLTLAGGPDGVRQRVAAEIQKTLRHHLL